MKIAVFSDSHGNTENMRRAIEDYRPDQILHLGDGVRDVAAIERLYPLIPIRNVLGNCDRTLKDIPNSLLLELGGVKIFMAHGHRYGVKMGLDAFLNTVYCSGAVLGLYGHTHEPFNADFGGIRLFNPGSCGYGRPTYGRIEAENGHYTAVITQI